MTFYARGLKSHKEYAMAEHRPELMRKLMLIYPSYKISWSTDGTRSMRVKDKILPEPIRVVKE